MAEIPLDSSAGRPRPMARPFFGAKGPPRPPLVGNAVRAAGSAPFNRHRAATPVVGSATAVDLTSFTPDGRQEQDGVDSEREAVVQVSVVPTPFGHERSVASLLDQSPSDQVDDWAQASIIEFEVPEAAAVSEAVVSESDRTPEMVNWTAQPVSAEEPDAPVRLWDGAATGRDSAIEAEAPIEPISKAADLEQAHSEGTGPWAGAAAEESAQQGEFENPATTQPVPIKAFTVLTEPDLSRVRTAEIIERLATRIRNGEIQLGHSAKVGSETAVLASLLATLLSEAP